ncbi:hypothetical protein [Jiella sonneratiae]|uniref:LTXXQ motif family protein n=1 Tax=Jiella sonneratiae TaxID=2816856 RepID=A0ABS3J1E2_9HYPH|nr:hypothetical protein [Jiella sonneratiae]MBO0903474.1 hypothetical protein [Jiella sonneratiae]
MMTSSPTAGSRRIAPAAIAAAVFFAQAGLVLAQDGATPREVPKDFVLPGPAPTNAPVGTGSGAAAKAGESAPEAGPSKSGQAAQNPVNFARAPAPATTDWPCIQRRVERISAGQIWGGPALPDAGEVEVDPTLRRLLDTVSARRTPLADAEAAVKDYLGGLPEAERETGAGRFVALLLDRLNAERSQIMSGIERYGAKQKALAARLRKETTAFSTHQNNPTANPTALDDARQQLLWDTRVFNERRQSLSYVCEVPTLIEQRAFALGRAAERAL